MNAPLPADILRGADCRPGDVFFCPSNWWHTTKCISAEPSVTFGGNYVDESNKEEFAGCWREHAAAQKLAESGIFFRVLSRSRLFPFPLPSLLLPNRKPVILYDDSYRNNAYSERRPLKEGSAGLAALQHQLLMIVNTTTSPFSGSAGPADLQYRPPMILRADSSLPFLRHHCWNRHHHHVFVLLLVLTSISSHAELPTPPAQFKQHRRNQADAGRIQLVELPSDCQRLAHPADAECGKARAGEALGTCVHLSST